MSDFTGQTIGNYQIHERIGRGGMATVYRATQTAIGREVAIKVLPAQFLEDKSFLERFTREVKVIADLQHPRILPIYDFGQHEGIPYIVMAYMAGSTLADRMSDGPLALDELVRLVREIAEGLDHAHRQGVVHRDFKPSNVLLDRYDNAHLADFGIAKVSESTVGLTGTDTVIGSPGYMAPEMAQMNEVTPLVDVYALGVTLYQMLSGRLPFTAETPVQVMMAHVNNPVPDVRKTRGDLSIGVQAVVAKAMAKRPAERFQSAGELAEALSVAAGGKVQRPDADRTIPVDTFLESDGVASPGSEQPPQAATVLEPEDAASSGGEQPPQAATVLESEGTASPGGGQSPQAATVLESEQAPSAGSAATVLEDSSSGISPGVPAVGPPPTRRGLPETVIGVLAAGGVLVVGAIIVGGLLLSGIVTLPGGRSAEQVPEATLPPAAETPAETPPAVQPADGETPAGAETEVAPGILSLDDLTGRIVFTRNESPPAFESNEIYVLSLPDGSLTRLTTNDVVDWIPRWSPDGQAISFTSYRAQNYDVWVMGADGSQPVQQIALPAWDDYPAWSPDGSQFAFSSTDFTGGVGNSEIFVGSGSGNVTRVTTNTARDEWPAFSPDGTTLADSSDRDGDMEIYLFPAGGGTAVQLTDDPAYDEQPAWSPDGEWIAFVRKSYDATGDGVFTQEDDNGYGDIWIGRRDGSEFQQLTTDHQAAHPAWSPDGQYIVFSRFSDLNANGAVDPEDGSDLWVISYSGSESVPLLEGPQRDWAPDWAAP